MPKTQPLTEETFMELWNNKLLPNIRHEITIQVCGIREDLKKLEERCSQIEKSQQFLADKYEDLSESLQSTKKLVSTTASKVHQHYETIKNNQEEIDKLYLIIDEMEQYSRRDCLEIAGIPKFTNENPKKLVTEIGSLTGVKIDENDISVAHRLPDLKNLKDRIIVKFVKRETKDELYYSRSKLVKKSTRDLPSMKEVQARSNRIFINESLTGYRRKLLGKINKYKKDQRYKFLWTINGKIFLKKDETSETCGPFTNEYDFEEFAPATVK